LTRPSSSLQTFSVVVSRIKGLGSFERLLDNECKVVAIV
jgi:hypothetical protein